MKAPSRIPLVLVAVLASAASLVRGASADDSVTYQLVQTVTLAGIPAGAHTVKWWIAIPQNDRFQNVLDLAVVSAPGTWRVVREPDRSNRFVLVEVIDPGVPALTAKVACTVRRRSVFVPIDPAKVGALDAAQRPFFADDLRLDAPHMAVTPQIMKMADDACGDKTNLYLQARALLGAVADYATHYSRDPSKPHFSPGDADSCLRYAGGTCTDIHSMFIALARARGIPARLQMGYRLLPANKDKQADPGYRCWVEYFVPNYGWIPADIVEASDPHGLGRDRWFTGLTERRVWLDSGRAFELPGRTVTSHRVNLMTIGYAEIDGVEARVLPEGDRPAQISRTVYYAEVESAATVAAK